MLGNMSHKATVTNVRFLPFFSVFYVVEFSLDCCRFRLVCDSLIVSSVKIISTKNSSSRGRSIITVLLYMFKNYKQLSYFCADIKPPIA